MAEPKDLKLYKRVKKMADKKFSTKTSVYKSSWIVKRYKLLGGKFKGSKPKSTGLRRWYKEGWVDLNRPIRNSRGKVIGYKKCGRKSVKSRERYPLCRPSRRVSPKTPRTYREISKRSLSKAKREKSRVKGSRHIKFGGSPEGKGQTSDQRYARQSHTNSTEKKSFMCDYCHCGKRVHARKMYSK